jgi:hypothetical protein
MVKHFLQHRKSSKALEYDADSESEKLQLNDVPVKYRPAKCGSCGKRMLTKNLKAHLLRLRSRKTTKKSATLGFLVKHAPKIIGTLKLLQR